MLLAGLVLSTGLPAACGGEDRVITETVTRTVATPPPPAQGSDGAKPTLSRDPLAKGEVLVTGNTAPKSFGPYRFEPGLYTFRYEQYSPELPGLDFAVEASNITVTLNRQPRKNAPDSAVLVNSPQRSGDNIANLSGRYFIDVGTADHSYVLRLTPRSEAAPPG